MPDQIKAGDATPGQKYTTRGQETVTAGELYMRDGVSYRRIIGEEGIHADLPLDFLLFPADRTGGVAHLVGLPEAELRPQLASLTPDQLDDLADEDGRTWVLDAVASLQSAAGLGHREGMTYRAAEVTVQATLATRQASDADTKPVTHVEAHRRPLPTPSALERHLETILYAFGDGLRVTVSEGRQPGTVLVVVVGAEQQHLDMVTAELKQVGSTGAVYVVKPDADEKQPAFVATLSCFMHGDHEGDACPSCSVNEPDVTQDTTPTWGSSVTGNDRLDIVKACSTPEEVEVLRQAAAESPLQTVVARELDRQLDSLKKVQDLVDNPGSMRPKTLIGKLRGMTEQARTKNRPGLIKLIERLLLVLDPPAPAEEPMPAPEPSTALVEVTGEVVMDAESEADRVHEGAIGWSGSDDNGPMQRCDCPHEAGTPGEHEWHLGWDSALEGMDAMMDGLPVESNPHRPGSPVAAAWAHGWTITSEQTAPKADELEPVKKVATVELTVGAPIRHDSNNPEPTATREPNPVATVWHFGSLGIAQCGADEPNMGLTDRGSHVTCPACIALVREWCSAPQSQEQEQGEVIGAEYELDNPPNWDQGNKPWPVQVAEASRACALEMIQEQEDTAELVEAWKEIECGSRDVGLQGEIERSWEALTGKPFTPDLVLVPVIPDQPEKSESNPPLTAVEISIVEDAGRLEAEIYKLKQERITEEGFWKAENERLALELEQARAEVAETSRRAVIAEVQGRYKLPETHGIYKDGDIEVVLPVDKLIETMDTPAAGMTDLQKWLAAWPLRAAEARAQGLRLELNLNNDHPSKP